MVQPSILKPFFLMSATVASCTAFSAAANDDFSVAALPNASLKVL
jgi:hypothetical protein